MVVKTEVRGDDSTMVRLEVTNTPSPDDPAVNVWEVRYVFEWLYVGGGAAVIVNSTSSYSALTHVCPPPLCFNLRFNFYRSLALLSGTGADRTRPSLGIDRLMPSSSAPRESGG